MQFKAKRGKKFGKSQRETGTKKTFLTVMKLPEI